MLKRGWAVLAVVALVAPLCAQSADVNAAIRREASASQILRSLHHLADVYGPRLTGSPSTRAAAEWALSTMAGWGLTNTGLESWDFGHPGWANQRVSAHIVSPVQDQLVTEVVAWTPGTQGTVKAEAFVLSPPPRPTPAELTAYLDGVKANVHGKIVLSGRPTVVPVNLTPRPSRQDDARLRSRYDPAGEGQPARGGDGQEATRPPMSAGEINRRVDEFLVANGAVVRVNDAGRELGQIAAFHNPTFDAARAVPTVVMRNEDYGRISRILADGTPVELEFTIVNRLFPEGRIAYNAVAEIEGSDLKREVVMLGGHLDSWQSATGATDNAIGCAVVMEAARILRAVGFKPRRTIRVALWSGEEQGLLGSQAYVREHFGSFEDPKPDYPNLVAYLNLDTGTGRIRGASVFGPPDAAAAVRDAITSFADLGVVGARAIDRRALGSTDSTSFNAAGLPGINFEQDPIQYESHTHHTNLDTYERIIEEDVRSSAIVIAATAYRLAMRDEGLPRFDKRSMPRAPGR